MNISKHLCEGVSVEFFHIYKQIRELLVLELDLSQKTFHLPILFSAIFPTPDYNFSNAVVFHLH